MPENTTAISNTAWKKILLTFGSFHGFVVEAGGPDDSSLFTIFLCHVKGLAHQAIKTPGQIKSAGISELYNANVLPRGRTFASID
jgi:hypothetical protein